MSILITLLNSFTMHFLSLMLSLLFVVESSNSAHQEQATALLNHITKIKPNTHRRLVQINDVYIRICKYVYVYICIIEYVCTFYIIYAIRCIVYLSNILFNIY